MVTPSHTAVTPVLRRSRAGSITVFASGLSAPLISAMRTSWPSVEQRRHRSRLHCGGHGAGRDWSGPPQVRLVIQRERDVLALVPFRKGMPR